MSGGLCPSKSTVYIGNLPFSLTNNDLHKLLEKYGRVVKVTTIKDKTTFKSKGVAFVLFLKKEDAQTCVRALNGTDLFGRTLKCTIAKDNGRASEFIRRKIYRDKTRCYECGDEGHLSYFCPQNMLGDREPEKKEKKKRRFQGTEDNDDSDADQEEDRERDEGEDPGLESLSAAIKYQQQKIEQEEMNQQNSYAIGSSNMLYNSSTSRKRFKKSAYFSDEEEEADDN